MCILYTCCIIYNALGGLISPRTVYFLIKRIANGFAAEYAHPPIYAAGSLRFKRPRRGGHDVFSGMGTI